ncbi:hypothetical protein WOC76_01980 [Methylocystis sp. IM3]|uniref:hypothetical protein n=1 Tax=unclassified Methylocystis TaxID=2625913 RepID=UPI0030F5DADC
MMDEEKPQTTPVREAASLSDVERREALKKIGRYAAYAAPLMVGLLKADAARAGIPVASGDT